MVDVKVGLKEEMDERHALLRLQQAVSERACVSRVHQELCERSSEKGLGSVNGNGPLHHGEHASWRLPCGCLLQQAP